jgi:ABC-type polysaccharide/polyol phosphate transport system ATPase subunit
VQFNCHQCGASNFLGHKSMHQQFSSALRNREFETHNAHSLRLVEPTHGQGKVALRVEAVSKCYGEIEAVANVSFDVRQGEIFGLLGLNGAGKTTLISILATERRPSSGDALNRPTLKGKGLHP